MKTTPAFSVLASALLAAAFPAAVAFADIAPLPRRTFPFPRRFPEKDPPAVPEELPPTPGDNPATQDSPANPEDPVPPLRPPAARDLDADLDF